MMHFTRKFKYTYIVCKCYKQASTVTQRICTVCLVTNKGPVKLFVFAGVVVVVGGGTLLC